MYKEEIHTMLLCIQNVGDLLMKYFKKKDYQITMKSENNPLTEADLVSNSLLIETIQKNFPKDAVLSEEISPQNYSLPDRHKTNRVWIIDPIDGTKEFISGLPEFSISVALIVNNEPALGFIYNPARNFFIHGGKGVGISMNSQPIHHRPPPPQKKEDLYPCFSRNEFKEGLYKQYDNQLPIRSEQIFGSIAYKLGLVAAGMFNLTISHRPKNEWDVAAGLCLFQEIGYQMTDLDSKNIILNKEDTLSTSIIGGSPEAIKIYKELTDSL